MKKRNHNTSLKELSPAKKRSFYIITLLFPIVLLLLLEITLRLFDYGPNLSLFKTETVNGRRYQVMNPDVKYRYFTHYQFTASLSPTYFEMPKPSGLFRIFCLGGSTTVGYPYWYNGSFSTFLRDRLQKTFPQNAVEVINVGMTATNSYTVLDMARELINYQPDLFIVYDGHNEFYGALGAASHESLGTLRWITTTYLRLIHFRTFLLLRDSYTKVLHFIGMSPAAKPAGTLMETLAQGQYIPYGSDAYWNCFHTFQENLNEFGQIARSRNIPVILGTQVSNLRDQSPFVSLDRDGEPPEVKASFHHHYSKALGHYQNGDFSQAISELQKAIAVDSFHADAHYLQAKCLDTLGNKRSALTEYRKSRDYDQLRFRCSSDFNNLIKAAADGDFITAVDMEEAFSAQSRDSLIGRDLMLEHLHPKSKGYFFLAKAYALAMRDRQYLAPKHDWDRQDTLNDEQLWHNRSLTDLDERIAIRRTEILTSGWPFQSQFPTVNAIDRSDTLGQIVEQVTHGTWPWVRAHEEAAKYYVGRHELRNAAAEYKVIINQFPTLDVRFYLELAKLLLAQNSIPELQEVLRASLTLSPTILAYRALGDIELNTGAPKRAAEYYQHVLEFPQSADELVQNGYLLAMAYARAGMRSEATIELLRILKMKPDYQPGVLLLQRMSIK